MQTRKFNSAVVFVGLLFLSGAAVLMIAQAQAPVRSTIAVASGALMGFGILSRGSQKTARRCRASSLKLKAIPIPGGLEWSPDGTKIAFHTQDGQNIDVYVVDGFGDGLKRLTDHEAEDSWPAWHPGGQKLAFTSNRDGNLEIYTMTAGGVVIGNITNDPASDKHPAWSPNGRHIAFRYKARSNHL